MKLVPHASQRHNRWPLLLLLVTATCHAQEVQDPLTIAPWIRVAGEWTQAPPEVVREEWAPATILRFKPDGEFVMLHCIVCRTASGTAIGVRLGDGPTVFAGRWQWSGADRVTVEFEKIEESFPAVGAPGLGERGGGVVQVSAGRLDFGDPPGDFRQDPLLTAEYYDGLADGIIAFWRSRSRPAP